MTRKSLNLAILYGRGGANDMAIDLLKNYISKIQLSRRMHALYVFMWR